MPFQFYTVNSSEKDLKRGKLAFDFYYWVIECFNILYGLINQYKFQNIYNITLNKTNRS